MNQVNEASFSNLPNIFVLGLKWLHLAAAQTYCLSVLTIRLSMPDWRTGHAQSNAPSHSPTRGFPYTNTLAAARLIRPRTQCIHPLSVRREGGVSVWELTSVVMTAHWKQTCGALELARSFQDACNQVLRTMSLHWHTAPVRAHWRATLPQTVPRWKRVSGRLGWWGFRVKMFLFYSWSFLASLQNSHFANRTFHIQLNYNWELLDIAFSFWVFKALNANCCKHQNH